MQRVLSGRYELIEIVGTGGMAVVYRALDQKTGRQVMELFHEINEEGRTIIMITHDAGIASHAKRIVRILDGNIGEGDTADA